MNILLNQEINYFKKSTKLRFWSKAHGKGLDCFSKKDLILEEPFFNTNNPLKIWHIPSPFIYNKLDVKAWFLNQHFLLFTEATNKANHLIISTHGGYLPTSSIVPIPQNTELVALGPHGWTLSSNINLLAQNQIKPYAFITRSRVFSTENTFETNSKILAGTSMPGYIKNYKLSKYQNYKSNGESYEDIARIVAASRSEQNYSEPVDILTVRKRIGRGYPDLKALFKTLQKNEIHYDTITLSFCRSNILLPLRFISCYEASKVV